MRLCLGEACATDHGHTSVEGETCVTFWRKKLPGGASGGGTMQPQEAIVGRDSIVGGLVNRASQFKSGSEASASTSPEMALKKFIAMFSDDTKQPPCRTYRQLICVFEHFGADKSYSEAKTREDLTKVTDYYRGCTGARRDMCAMSRGCARRVVGEFF